MTGSSATLLIEIEVVELRSSAPGISRTSRLLLLLLGLLLVLLVLLTTAVASKVCPFGTGSCCGVAGSENRSRSSGGISARVEEVLLLLSWLRPLSRERLL